MKVLGCGSIAVATIKMTIGKMQKDGTGFMVYDSSSENSKKPFWVFMPKHVAKKLEVGDTIVVTCTPTEDLSFAGETFIVKKVNSPTSIELIYDRGNYTVANNIDIFQ